MADSSYKVLGENDRVTTRTLLHEAIPITGTIVSGTYSDLNIKDFSHGMFQSVYDYPYLSSSANHIFDITVGISSQSQIGTITSQKSKKNNIYNQMAQVLVGYDKTGSVLQFDEDGDFVAGGRKIHDAIFLNFSRLLTKDEVKKETFKMEIGTNDAFNAPMTSERVLIQDLSASNEYRVNSPAGEYGILYATSSLLPAGFNPPTAKQVTISGKKYAKCGLIYYQAGIVVLTSSLFQGTLAGGFVNTTNNTPDGPDWFDASNSITTALKGEEISGSANALRRRIYNIQFNNTTELNSTIYFCRANHNEFNYSANPTYLKSSKIRVKNETSDVPVSYITTIGLYNDRRELLAVAKLSEPLKKSPDTEFTLRVRLDY